MLRIKFSKLTDQQQKQVKSFYEDAIKEKKMALNQQSFFINSMTGTFIPSKDF